MRTPRRRSKSTKATPTEPTHSRTLSETLVLTETTEPLGASGVIPADPNHPRNVQRRREEQDLQLLRERQQKAEARAARFSGRHQEPGDLRQELAKIVRSREYQGKSWKSIMREVARRLDDGRVVGDRLYYRDSSLGTLDIASAAFQAKLSTVQHAQKKS